MSKFRLNIPKSEEDLKELIEEISEAHEHEHHHHHEHAENEVVIAINVLIDAVNDLASRLERLDKRIRSLEKQTLAIGKLQSLALKLLLMEQSVDKEKVIAELKNIIEELEKKE